MVVIPEKNVIMKQLWRVNYESFSIAGLCFVHKIYKNVSQIYGMHIRNCIKSQYILKQMNLRFICEKS